MNIFYDKQYCLIWTNREETIDMKLTETEIIAKLNELHDKYKDEEKVPGARMVYGQSSWFNDDQTDMLLRGYEALLKNPTVAYVYSPLMNQYNGDVLSAEDADYPESYAFEWATKTFEADVTAMKNSDLGVMLNTASAPDSGQAFESGYLYAQGKPVVSVYEGDLDKYPINLMISFSSSSYVTSTDELATFDFRSIPMRKFSEKII